MTVSARGVVSQAERVKREMGVSSVTRFQLSPKALPVTNVTHLHNSSGGVEVSTHPAHTEKVPPVFEGASQSATVLSACISRDIPRAGKWRVVHVFCGNAQLGSVLESKGFSVVAVDLPSCGRIRDGSWVPLELWRSAEQQLLVTAIREARSLALLWIEVPAATFSRAREVPLPKHLRSRLSSAVPLRSDDQPAGIDGLCAKSKEKVDRANALAEFALKLVSVAQAAGGVWIIANPRGSSYLWKLSGYSELADSSGVAYDFQACMWGAGREKWVRYLSNWPELSVIRAKCDGGHEHTPWGSSPAGGVFQGFHGKEHVGPTSMLCDLLAELLLRTYPVLPPCNGSEGLLESLCEASGAGLWAPDSGKQDRALQRAAVGVQTRGTAHPRLLSEFQELICVPEPEGMPALQEGAVLCESLDMGGRILPAGAKVLRRIGPEIGVLGEWTLGAPWSPATFLAASRGGMPWQTLPAEFLWCWRTAHS